MTADIPLKPAEAEPAAPTVAEVVPFPSHDATVISEEERVRRVMAEAERLAGLAPGEWKFWVPKRAGELGVEPKLLAELVEAQLKTREQKKSRELAEARLGEQRAQRLRQVERDRQREQQRIGDAAEKKAKQKAKALADIVKLPSAEQEGKIAELARKLEEDVAALSAEFAEYAEAETSSSTVSEWDDEPWPEPVATAVMLEELIARINRHIKAKPHQVLCIALWAMMAWVHEVAAHYSVYLVATSPRPDCGKTTLIVEVIGRLTPKSYIAGGATVASIFRLIDRENPTLIMDNVDTRFQHNPELTELYLMAWTRGIRIPRVEMIFGERQTRFYNVFCPKAVSLVGTNLPEPLIGRSLLIELWPMKPGEKVDKVDSLDQELMDEFKTLRRKLARWRDDNAAGLKGVKPLTSAAFISRSADNWTLLWAIAELAGPDWAERARTAAERLSQEELVEPSWLDRMLAELWGVFVEERRANILSKQLVARLAADPTSAWSEYGRGHGHQITEREIAALLRKTVRIRPRPIGKPRTRGYHRADFLEKEIFQHFLGRDPLIRSPAMQPKKKKSRRRRKASKASG